MDADLVKIEEMVMKGEEVTSTDPSDVKIEEPYRQVVIPQPPVIQPYQHESLQCFQCFITFCNAKAKERHMKKSHREEYKQQLQQCDTLFTCYVCDRTFSSSEELTNHQSTHNKEDKPFKCTCKESFRTFSELTSHRRQQCPERQFQCKDCGATYRSPVLLRNHRLATHPVRSDAADPADATKFHRCAKCNAGFNTEAELLQHQEDHAGSEHCNGGTPAKRPRGRPPKTEKPAKQKKEATPVGEGEKEKEEEATVEAAKAKPKKEAVAAVASRRGRPPKAVPKKAHPCGECEESFARPEQLEAHVTRVHTEGRYTCPTCSKSFSRESNLKAHQQSHTKEKKKEVKKKPAGRGKR